MHPGARAGQSQAWAPSRVPASLDDVAGALRGRRVG
eukprot:CAMPEP_0206020820 /NCGR_PEP_ID=MMETSP1464-20131121/31724_1 /ASSEMBLY_ACC=CAM_ASM_001124 /TAXON_ID=119497 /ORGANISM="Exanthemachrysis gayraliae, Strain RCC1523" /LENGTH=35 /DNA_ID= /DNA_START= /DNA_END= /DNA_ORIENTATION=